MSTVIDTIIDIILDLTSMDLTFDQTIIFLFIICSFAGIISFLLNYTLGYMMLG